MIEILGEKGTAEYEAAESLAKALVKLWPGIDKTPEDEDDIKIAASVKISGYPVSDIDLVVCGRLKYGRRFVPKKPLRDMDGKRVIGRPVAVQNFVVAIEVKDHDAKATRITGDNIDVKYSRGGPPKWKSATEQNIKQVHSIQAYLNDRGADLYIHRCLIMRGLDQISTSGVLARNFTAEAFFSELAATARVGKSGSAYVLRSGNNDRVENALRASIFHPIVPSELDRKRMDRIAARSERLERMLPDFGKKMVELRGHGGTGKTVMALQLAWQKYKQTGERTLVLTYNHALASDIRRLLALMGISSSPEEGGITVDTVMSFMFTWFSRLQLMDKEPDFVQYDDLCREATAMLEEGAIGQDDMEKIIEADPERFDFDSVIVDEAQDWPEGEVSLLKALYGHSRICLADGIDQLVRGKRARWESGIPKDERVVESLNRCLRMKRNLAIFANEVARDAGISWDLVPSDEAGGGRVILIDGSYINYPRLHKQLLDGAKRQGNDEIDFLFCVPAVGVDRIEGSKKSKIATILQSRDYEVWDGVDDATRKDFPRSKNAFRVTQYASCRGLEGWVVVLEMLDEFWSERYNDCLQQGLADEKIQMESIEEIATRDAWRWVLIPLTRPIDTLVISISNFSSVVGKSISASINRHPDIVEYYTCDEDLE